MTIAILTASLLVASCGNKQAAPAVDVESLQPAIEQAQSAGQQSEMMNTRCQVIMMMKRRVPWCSGVGM